VILKPPESLLIPCEKPTASKLETNEDLAVFASNVLAAWEACAAKIEAIKAFYVDSESKP
jgi:hypothetical protein